MKYLNKLVVVLLVLAVSSCEITDLDKLDNPNAVSPEGASIDDLFTSIQGSFNGVFDGMNGFTRQVTRMTAMIPFSVYDYTNATQPTNYDGIWRQAYADLFPDVDAAVAIAEERGLLIHAGAAKVMKAYVQIALVDFFGDVPLTDAGQGTDVISPGRDGGAAIYAATEALLDEAIAQLSNADETTTKPKGDVFYGGDADSWLKAANSIKMKMAINTRDAGKLSSIVNGGNFIDEVSEDLQSNFGKTRVNPNSRHPDYNNSYETTDGDYLGNYYMWLLVGDKVDATGATVTDPRLRFYFYRQVEDATGLDKNVYGCHFTDLPDQDLKPAHYNAVDPRLPYCVLPNGYYGRDHINGEGIPPDGNIRTVYGLYPAAGQFDDNTYSETQQSGTTGGQGEGINPIILSSFTYFWRAEAALTMGTADDAREMLEKGMRESIDKVFSFKNLVPGTMSRQIEDPRTGEVRTVEELYVPTDEDVEAYITFVLDSYDAADDDGKLDIVMKEYMIALWGNGLESYNNYRRTGKPNNMAPTLEPNPGSFIRSAYYPAVHINLNSNATQKDLTQKVFWDPGLELR
ncbi:MAG: SusD/RagB family nutrient-binding outer membrane lipoprotein [Saprospiraceae bacterium]|nr:SusD/RagB family nutrient-binding outer membrane lipoprotein [Saprospiraceae bacterium]